MSRISTLTAINCTQCGAGLDILGGGRVVSHICPYCGTELDANDGYKVLSQYANMQRPETPFRLGMTGTLFGVEWTIIGTLGQIETYRGRTWRWVDHQLYSPTHGYAWITVERGHFTYTRRIRDAAWLSERQVEAAEGRPSVMYHQTRYQYYETTTTSSDFIEGEFTWRPKLGQKTTAVSVLSDDAMITFEQSAAERETYRSTYLTGEQVCAAFGIEIGKQPSSQHPLIPVKANPNLWFIVYCAAAFAGIALVLGLYFAGSTGPEIFPKQQFSAQDFPLEITFDVTDIQRLVQVDIVADVDNSWLWAEIEVSDPRDQALFEAGREVSYYHGVEDGESWAEGTRASTIRFRPTISGEYTLEMSIPESGVGTYTDGELHFQRARIAVYEGVTSGFWLIAAAVLLALIAGGQFARHYVAIRRRFAGGDWSE